MILVSYGTRPEIIKLFPVIKELQRNNIEFKTLFTGQHVDLYKDFADLIPEPDFSFSGVFYPDQSLVELSSKILQSTNALFKRQNFKSVIVQGDTQSAFTIALCAFLNKIEVFHVEAGLRTYNKLSPFPEEANRSMIGCLSSLNFASTPKAYDNLYKEGAKNIYMVGNTVVDACKHFNLEPSYQNFVLVTVHRRENFGEKIQKIFFELNELAKKLDYINFIFPMHPNPNVQDHRDILTSENIKIVEPVGYKSMLNYIANCLFIITDSGGIQEEAACFHKKVLVCRENTERGESVDAGLAKLVGTNILDNCEWAYSSPVWTGQNPYGNGNSAKKIVDIIKEKI